jgi:hypothetical protein
MKYETRCVKIQLKPNKLDYVREWAKMVNETRREEAIVTLRNETIIIEAFFLDSTAEGDFLIVFMKAESFEKAEKSVKSSTYEIDLYHQKFKKEVWEHRKELETLVDLDRISEVFSF